MAIDKVRFMGESEIPKFGQGVSFGNIDYYRPIRHTIYNEFLGDVEYDHVFLLPTDFQWCTAVVAPLEGGSANLFRTVSSPESIRNGRAVWIEWDHGEIRSPRYYDWENPWVAFLVKCSVAARVEIVAKK